MELACMDGALPVNCDLRSEVGGDASGLACCGYAAADTRVRGKAAAALRPHPCPEANHRHIRRAGEGDRTEAAYRLVMTLFLY